MVFRDTEVQQRSHWAKIQCWEDCALLGASRGESTALPVPAARGHWFHGWRPLPTSAKPAMEAESFSCCTLVLCSQQGLSFWGLVWLFWVHLDNPGQCLISRPLTWVLSAEPLLPYKATWSQAARIRAWGSLGGVLLTASTHCRYQWTRGRSCFRE